MSIERKQSTILCLTFNNFPNKDAGSVRLLALAKGMAELGYTVKIISMGKDVQSSWQQLENEIFHMSARNAANGKLSLLKNYLWFNSHVNREIDKIKNLKAVFVFNTLFYVFSNKKLKKLGVPLIYDSTEWYNSCQFKQGVLAIEYISNQIVVRSKTRKPWRVIAISRLLEEHYKKKGLRVKRIPAVMDVASFPTVDYRPNEKIKVVYAGSPGIKDALYMIIEALNSLPDAVKAKFEFRIIGATREQFTEQNGIKDIPENVTFMGRLPREQVIEELSTADFTTFLRDGKMRFVNAGFPSKLAESMSMGVPVITNLTSDLSYYLTNGENAVVVQDFSSEKYAKALTEIAAMFPDQIAKMHIAAKKTALECFDYSNYVGELNYLMTGEFE